MASGSVDLRAQQGGSVPVEGLVAELLSSRNGHVLRSTVVRMSLQKIISGGQTGTDRDALDAALEAGFPCGGWCPEGREAEDGPIPQRYPLQVMPGAGYRKRTIQNVQDSDGTAILCVGEPMGGSALTLAQCRRLDKPHIVIDGLIVDPTRAGMQLTAFVRQYAIQTLNVAGPSEARAAGASTYAKAAVRTLLLLSSQGL